MLKKFFESFTATHITVMFVAALMAPTALFATTAATHVNIADAFTSKTAAVDTNRRLVTVNPIEALTDNPMNLVNA